MPFPPSSISSKNLIRVLRSTQGKHHTSKYFIEVFKVRSSLFNTNPEQLQAIETSECIANRSVHELNSLISIGKEAASYLVEWNRFISIRVTPELIRIDPLLALIAFLFTNILELSSCNRTNLPVICWGSSMTNNP